MISLAVSGEAGLYLVRALDRFFPRTTVDAGYEEAVHGTTVSAGPVCRIPLIDSRRPLKSDGRASANNVCDDGSGLAQKTPEEQ